VAVSQPVNREELKKLLGSWIADITGEPPPALTDETDLVKDVGLDSLALAELGAKLRLQFKIKLRPGELVRDLRVGTVLSVVLAKLS
jgi:acyl carrier protein